MHCNCSRRPDGAYRRRSRNLHRCDDSALRLNFVETDVTKDGPDRVITDQQDRCDRRLPRMRQTGLESCSAAGESPAELMG